MQEYKKSEDEEQEAVVEYIELKKGLVWHTANGGFRNKWEAKRLKRLGVRAGVPDLTIAEPRGIYHGLYIEMKTLTGRPSKEQKEFIAKLNKRGYLACVCYGADQAIDIYDRYMRLKAGEVLS